MKRILTSCAALLIVTMFFTGCNSLIGSLEVDSKKIEESVAESSSIDLNPTQSTEAPPDFFAQNMEEKFQHLNAPRAFQLKGEHSQESGDLESFQIGALLEDNTFVYAYSTRLREGKKPRDMVHCAAFYQYDAGELKVFHENRFSRDWETSEDMDAKDIRDEEEAFFIQVCESGKKGQEEIFIYDNGEGYLYRRDGTQKLHVDIAAFIHLQYPNVHSVSVVHALTDGDNRIYLELSIEKEAVNIPEEDEDADEITEDEDEDKIEEEINALDQEVKNKVENVILVYEVRTLKPDLHQKNENFEAQISAWTGMAEGKTFERDDAPDGEKDWETVLEALPDQWSGADIQNMESMAVYEWKNEPVFLYQDGVCTFVPNASAYQPFVNLTEDWEFWKQFIPYENHYSRLYGKVGPVTYHDKEKFSRTFTITWTEETPNEEGGTVSEKKSDTVTQDLVVDTRHRYAPLTNAYLEAYWVMDKGKVTELGNALGQDILCSNEKGEAYWILPGGNLEKIGEFDEDHQIQAIKDGDQALILSYDTNKMKIKTDKRHTGSGLPNVEEEIDFQRLAGMAKPGKTVYDKFFQKKNEEQITGGFDGYGGIYLTGEQILRTKLSLDKTVVVTLMGLGQDVFLPSGRGYLLTIQDKGLIYYDAGKQRSMILLEGSWYRSWKKGNQYVSVGFAGGASYEELDIAFSRVYTYHLDDVVNEAMKDEMENLLEEKKKEQQIEQSRAQEEATRESTDPAETVEDMAERWEREHPEEEREKAASKALEELEKKETESEESDEP